MTGMPPRKWFQVRLRWAILKEGRGLHSWREAEHFFISKDWDTAFQEALRLGYQGEHWFNPRPDQRNAPRFHCRFAEMRSLEELGPDRTSFQVDLGEQRAREGDGFDPEVDPARRVPAPIF